MSTQIYWKYLASAVIALLISCGWFRPTWANIGPGSWGGQLVVEPTGLETVEILHETLAIDLRPLAGGGRCK